MREHGVELGGTLHTPADDHENPCWALLEKFIA